MIKRTLFCLCLLLLLPAVRAEVLPGIEVLVRHHAEALRGKRIAILTNPTGVDRELRSTIDLVRALPGVEVVRLFAPEHGIRGGYDAGDRFGDETDPVTGLSVISLHGRRRAPTPEMLEGLDVVLYDIQDVGHRAYTFISTLTLMMEACKEQGVALWVLDRPDPLGGRIVAGPMLERELVSFIGIHPVPQVYGMTPGEFASMIRAERTPKLELKIVPMQGWRRGMTYGDLGWPWVPPSPHIPDPDTCFFYGMTGTMGELRLINEGVGTPQPFELIGMPELNGIELAQRLNARNLPGVKFRPVTYTPKYGTHAGKTCQGVQIHLTAPTAVDPARVQIEILAALLEMPSAQKRLRGKIDDAPGREMFLKALGDRKLYDTIVSGGDPRIYLPRIEDDLKRFEARRREHLIYD